MFNDKFGLTEAVLEGRKTQTRRVMSVELYNRVDWKAFEEGNMDCMIMDDPWQESNILNCGKYHVGDKVAIAQSYKDIFEEDSAQGTLGHPKVLERNACAG